MKGRRVCLFAQFDPRMLPTGTGRILPSTLHYLRAIRDCEFVIHIALSGMTRLHDEDAALFAALGIVAHPRRNGGHDFGAWQFLMEKGCVDAADLVLLANDSVFGPLAPLAPIVGSMQDRPVDVWGMVESRESAWHLQSWFLCLSADALASPAIRRVMRQPFHSMQRDEIVLHGELGLGAAIRAEGLRWDARWRQPTRRLRRLVPGNPMHLDFLSVIRTGRVPFLKADLLRDNPARIGWVGQWRKLLNNYPDFPPALIEQALALRPGLPHARQTAVMRGLYAILSCDQPEAALSALRR